jgi:hypothetical protein
MAGKRRETDAQLLRETSSREGDDGYFDVLAQLGPGWRVVVARDGLTWVLQRRVPPRNVDSRRSAPAMPGYRPRWWAPPTSAWIGVRFHQRRDELIRSALAHAGEIDAIAMAVLVSLPDIIATQIRTHADAVLDRLHADLRRKPRARPAGEEKPQPAPIPTPDHGERMGDIGSQAQRMVRAARAGFEVAQ